jgi:hypothetical protein
VRAILALYPQGARPAELFLSNAAGSFDFERRVYRVSPLS